MARIGWSVPLPGPFRVSGGIGWKWLLWLGPLAFVASFWKPLLILLAVLVGIVLLVSMSVVMIRWALNDTRRREEENTRLRQ